MPQPPIAWGALGALGSISQWRLWTRIVASGLHITISRAVWLGITSIAYRIGEP